MERQGGADRCKAGYEATAVVGDRMGEVEGKGCCYPEEGDGTALGLIVLNDKADRARAWVSGDVEGAPSAHHELSAAWAGNLPVAVLLALVPRHSSRAAPRTRMMAVRLMHSPADCWTSTNRSKLIPNPSDPNLSAAHCHPNAARSGLGGAALLYGF